MSVAMMWNRSKPKDAEFSDNQFIRTIDYDELERKFSIHKCYPQFIHNDIPTPQLKKLVEGKPIYAKANSEEDKRAMHQRQRKEKHELRRKMRDEKREMKQDEKDLKKAYKEVKRDMKQSRRRGFSNDDQDDVAALDIGNDVGKNIPGLNDTFDFEDENAANGLKYPQVMRGSGEQLSTNNESRNSSIDLKSSKTRSTLNAMFRNMGIRMPSEKAHNAQVNDPLVNKLSRSYDQTKSSMTASRKRTQFNMLNPRPDSLLTDKIGMYFFFFLNFSFPNGVNFQLFLHIRLLLSCDLLVTFVLFDCMHYSFPNSPNSDTFSLAYIFMHEITRNKSKGEFVG